MLRFSTRRGPSSTVAALAPLAVASAASGGSTESGEPDPGRHRIEPSRRRPRVGRDRPRVVRDRPRVVRDGPRVARDHRTGLPGLAALALVTALGLTACGGSIAGGEGGQSVAKQAASGDALNLRGACPATVVVQSSWFAQAEHGAVYQLLGKGYTIDGKRKSVTGPLVASGLDTGVRLEIRAGGPAIGSQQVSAQMYADRSITIGMLNTDELIGQSATAPVLGVMAPLDLDPQVIMWDPKAHPDWNTISDVGQTDAKVLYYSGSTFMDYLLGSGILRQSQVDASYDGNPSRFVTDRGQDAVQGYATNEPYAWSHEVPQWGKPLQYALVNDTGYSNYANVLGIRPGDRDSLDGCLHKLVPILQQAQVAFIRQPGPAIGVMLAANGAYSAFPYDRPLAEYAVKTMLDLGIVGNGGNHTLGDFDADRVTKLVGILTPIFTARKKPIKTGLTPADVTTNTYVDTSINLPTSK
jgi:hypothetical protein